MTGQANQGDISLRLNLPPQTVCAGFRTLSFVSVLQIWGMETPRHPCSTKLAPHPLKIRMGTIVGSTIGLKRCHEMTKPRSGLIEMCY
jgi:hypothetical protein